MDIIHDKINLTVKLKVIPVTCSWGRTRWAGAEGRCRSLWKESGVGSPHLAVRLGWVAACCLVVLECCGPGALRRWGPCSRHSARGWACECRSKPASVTNRPTVQTPRSTEGWRRRQIALVSVNIRQLWKYGLNEKLQTPPPSLGPSSSAKFNTQVMWTKLVTAIEAESSHCVLDALQTFLH